MPALLTRISIAPNALAAAATMPSMSAGFDMSAAEKAALTPNSISSPRRVTSILAASPNPFSITLMPDAAKARAMPRPMPLVEPVTIALFPASEWALRGELAGSSLVIFCMGLLLGLGGSETDSAARLGFLHDHRQKRQEREPRERGQHLRRQRAFERELLHGVEDAAEPGADGREDEGSGNNADESCEHEGLERHSEDGGGEIDGKERKCRQETQNEKVAERILSETGLELCKPGSGLGFERIAERGSCSDEQGRCAGRGTDDGGRGALECAEQEAARERQHDGARNREGCRRSIGENEEQDRLAVHAGDERHQLAPVLAELLERH